MKKLSLPLAIISLFIFACAPKTDKTSESFKSISDKVKSEFAPDGRSVVYEAELKKSENNYVLKGVTTSQAAKENLLSGLLSENINPIDSMVVLPDPSLGDKTFGLTRESVINIRTRPSYSAESATQTVMGTPLRILERRSGWFRVQTPEGYIAWVTAGGVEPMNESAYNLWKGSKRYILTTHYALALDKPNKNGDVVSDIVWGGIVESDGKNYNGYLKVKLPKGTEAYLPKEHLEEFTKWLDSRNPSPDNIIATGKQFVGFPYMWGGTSIKAMDCSGFTKVVYYLNGIITLRDASQQGYTGDDIEITPDFANLKKGDLIFFGSKATAERKERLTHVGIYIGDGVFIHSATSVRINSLKKDSPIYYEGSDRFIRARRLLDNVDNGKDVVSIKNHPWYF